VDFVANNISDVDAALYRTS
jgi:dynein intermediate chain